MILVLGITFVIIAKILKINDAELLACSLFYCTFAIVEKLNDVRVDVRDNLEKLVKLLESKEDK